MSSTIALPFRPDAMTPAQLAAVSYLARYTGQTGYRANARNADLAVGYERVLVLSG